MSIDLKGKKILVTRPTGQADNICKLIEANNGHAIRLPAIEILPPDNNVSLSRILGNLSNYEIGIFISRNAVLNTVQHPDLNIAQLNELTLIAMGAGTAEQLNYSGIDNVIFIEGRSSSEELLKIEELQADSIINKKILIFRGQGGRELLADSLRERGAEVEYIEVYKRHCPQYDQSKLDEVWSNSGPEIIIVTSKEALNNLFNILSDKQREQLKQKQIVTIGTRIAELARELGFVKQALIAKHTTDSGILETLK